ncbi:MAG TPA: radical SAM protein [Candidatus Izemoplasmatales bacterium]|nr:radical SAM protein [Candidatus Izemoplasmatales bacterium]
MTKHISPFKKMLARKAVKYIDKDPETNIPKILEWLEKTDKNGHKVGSEARQIQEVFMDKGGNWHKLIMSLWSDVDDHIRVKLFENFVVNTSLIGGHTLDYYRQKLDINVPWAILMDPTSACNLHCIGCWAAEYGHKQNLTLEELDDIINQGKKLGTHFYIFSGGEPMVRKNDIIKLCEKHQDCAFLAFTNGTLIDDKFAEDCVRVGNFVPAISVEGFEEATDSRRGEGTYKRLTKGMEILKKHKVPFGVSCCYTSANTADIGSEAFIDDIIAKGAKFAWFFTYIPVGKDAVSDLMVSPKQRKFMYDKLREYRKTKPLFTLDFWNDGEYAGGCIAGGRRYLHINANGDIEPCAFIHYAEKNIHKDTLMDALRSPLFMQYHKRQPFNKNMLRPCPLLDNPEQLEQMVTITKALSTDMQKPENVCDLCAKTKAAAKKWTPIADKLWEANPKSRQTR